MNEKVEGQYWSARANSEPAAIIYSGRMAMKIVTRNKMNFGFIG
jgi:hypothetical protein